MNAEDARVVRVYADPDPAKSGRIGYFCHVCGHEEICPRYAMPTVGFNLSDMTKHATERVVWVCSWSCLLEHVTTL